MKIRKAVPEDMERILEIYACAREQMKRNGNPTQWGDEHPEKALIAADIEKGDSYVIESNGRICGVFAFLLGEEPTYAYIENGSWKNDEPYGTIHRVAGDGTVRGILRVCLEFCERLFPNVRVDTHADNHIMQHLLEKYDYEKCGIIYVEDGSPRIAYQKSAEDFK